MSGCSADRFSLSLETLPGCIARKGQPRDLMVSGGCPPAGRAAQGFEMVGVKGGTGRSSSTGDTTDSHGRWVPLTSSLLRHPSGPVSIDDMKRIVATALWFLAGWCAGSWRLGSSASPRYLARSSPWRLRARRLGSPPPVLAGSRAEPPTPAGRRAAHVRGRPPDVGRAASIGRLTVTIGGMPTRSFS